MKIFDVFTFFNELDLLEIRLEILNDTVDYFVLTECTQTFSGKPKELFYENNKKLFKKFHHKIIHQITDIVPTDFEDARRLLTTDLHPLNRYALENALTSDNVPPGEIHWLKEFYQKELIRKPLEGIAEDNDIILISDLDEIWNKECLSELFDGLKLNKNTVFKFKQLPYVYYLNNRSDEKWAGTLAAKYHIIHDNCLNHLRTASKTPYKYIENGGWHFTFMGGQNRIKLKIESYGHQEYNNDNIKNNIENNILNNKDFIGRPFVFWKEESDLPEFIKNNKAKYNNLFKN